MQPSTLVKQARVAAGLTQAELAERAGVKQPEIARLESARANPRIATLDRVVAAAGHSLILGLDRGFGIDETLIAGSLELSPFERLRRFESFYEFAQSVGGTAFAARGS
jgi:transcriptional regulator with XRE-family HTH domain